MHCQCTHTRREYYSSQITLAKTAYKRGTQWLYVRSSGARFCTRHTDTHSRGATLYL